MCAPPQVVPALEPSRARRVYERNAFEGEWVEPYFRCGFGFKFFIGHGRRPLLLLPVWTAICHLWASVGKCGHRAQNGKIFLWKKLPQNSPGIWGR
jgi:hypothetical protein